MVSGDGAYILVCGSSNLSLRTKLAELASIIKLHGLVIDFEHNNTKFRIKVDKGGLTDGLSVPKIFQWYLPAWNDSNVLYNIAGICHDGAYGSELLAKDIADELFYQGLVMAGISKSKAKVAKYAVQYLAGLHYGRKNDDFGISEYVSVEPV